jgi:hypothetical protein
MIEGPRRTDAFLSVRQGVDPLIAAVGVDHSVCVERVQGRSLPWPVGTALIGGAGRFELAPSLAAEPRGAFVRLSIGIAGVPYGRRVPSLEF